MGWKDWPSGLKVGIILGVVFFLISLFLSFALFSKTPNADLGFAIPIMIIGLPIYWIVGYIVNISSPTLANSHLFSAIIGIFSVTIQWFIIGYIIGWIYGKMKRK